MKRYRQFEPVLVSDFEVSEWQHPAHNHNHHELIYIKHGTGTHYINNVSVAYNKGDVFLLGPEEEHYFEISQSTRFIYLKFTDVYIHQEANELNHGLRHLEYLIKSRETHLSSFRFTEHDKAAVDCIFDVILTLKSDMLYNEELIWLQVLTLSHILQRNMPQFEARMDKGKDMQALFCYIHKHIYTPDKLKANQMASHFNLAHDYLGPYFKRKAGITLRNYIADYRTNLIKKRMASGKYTLKELAVEFGLTDESHASKYLKRLV